MTVSYVHDGRDCAIARHSKTMRAKSACVRWKHVVRSAQRARSNGVLLMYTYFKHLSNILYTFVCVCKPEYGRDEEARTINQINNIYIPK